LARCSGLASARDESNGSVTFEVKCVHRAVSRPIPDDRRPHGLGLPTMAIRADRCCAAARSPRSSTIHRWRLAGYPGEHATTDRQWILAHIGHGSNVLVRTPRAPR
jgi:hypothetical protein